MTPPLPCTLLYGGSRSNALCPIRPQATYGSTCRMHAIITGTNNGPPDGSAGTPPLTTYNSTFRILKDAGGCCRARLRTCVHLVCVHLVCMWDRWGAWLCELCSLLQGSCHQLRT